MDFFSIFNFFFKFQTKSGKPEATVFTVSTPSAACPAIPLQMKPYSPVAPVKPSGGSDDAFKMTLMKEIGELRRSVGILHKKIDATNRRFVDCESLLKSVLGNKNILLDIARVLNTKEPQQVVNNDSSAVFDLLKDIPE
jgi:hypothetical protein